MTSDRGHRQFYRVLAKSFHDGRLLHPGETVALFDDEAGPHFELLTRPTPKAAEKPAPKKK